MTLNISNYRVREILHVRKPSKQSSYVPGCPPLTLTAVQLLHPSFWQHL